MTGNCPTSITIDWLETQLEYLEVWIDDISTESNEDLKLVECVQGHRQWLKSEITVLRNPDKYRLSAFATNIVYPLVSDVQAVASY